MSTERPSQRLDQFDKRELPGTGKPDSSCCWAGTGPCAAGDGLKQRKLWASRRRLVALQGGQQAGLHCRDTSLAEPPDLTIESQPLLVVSSQRQS